VLQFSGRARRTRRAVWISLATLVIALPVVIGVFYITGGWWYVIATPSMGEYAPVGTLVLGSVAGLASLRQGTVILFHPPSASGEVYFHRISGLVLHVVSHYYVVRYWRFPVRVFGWSVLVSLAAYLLKPFVRAVLLSQVVAHGRASSSLVPTGLLDITAHAVHGTTAVLRPGEAGEVYSSHVASSGFFEIDLSPSFGVATWVLLLAIWLVPLLLCVVYALRRPLPDPV
jgi:hypothetical protein